MVPYKDGLTIPHVNKEICVGCGGCEYAVSYTHLDVYKRQGLANVHISVFAAHPNGTRTNTERLRSPQQTLVGAS